MPDWPQTQPLQQSGQTGFERSSPGEHRVQDGVQDGQEILHGADGPGCERLDLRDGKVILQLPGTEGSEEPLPMDVT